MLTTEQFQRFMTKVLVPTNPNGRWEWNAHKDKNGYEFFWINRKLHRVAYAHFYDEDPGEMFVCHTCDNPKCVNPAHLWLGTRTDNAQDMVAKGRAPTHIGDIVRMDTNERQRIL